MSARVEERVGEVVAGGEVSLAEATVGHVVGHWACVAIRLG